MDITETQCPRGHRYITRSTVRTWTINLHRPDKVACETTGDPALWRYAIYDDEDVFVETDFYGKSREDTLAFACVVVAELDKENQAYGS
mgnify:CR=1 FL=1